MEDNNNSNGNGNGNNGNHRSGSSSPHESLAHQRMVSPRSKHNHQNGNNNNKSYSSNGANQKNGKGIVPHVEDAAAREAHDIFNLIALVGSSVRSILLCRARNTCRRCRVRSGVTHILSVFLYCYCYSRCSSSTALCRPSHGRRLGFGALVSGLRRGRLL
jgi:hypothetical protein